MCGWKKFSPVGQSKCLSTNSSRGAVATTGAEAGGITSFLIFPENGFGIGFDALRCKSNG